MRWHSRLCWQPPAADRRNHPLSGTRCRAGRFDVRTRQCSGPEWDGAKGGLSAGQRPSAGLGWRRRACCCAKISAGPTEFLALDCADTQKRATWPSPLCGCRERNHDRKPRRSGRLWRVVGSAYALRCAGTCVFGFGAIRARTRREHPCAPDRAGQSGGAWDTIEAIIRDTLTAKGVRVTIYELPPKRQSTGTELLI